MIKFHCQNCSQHISTGDEDAGTQGFCPSCGQKLIVPGSPLPKSPFPESHGSSTPRIGPKGIGGWLLFFCVQLTIIAPLFSLGMMVLHWKQNKPAFVKFRQLENAMIWENFWIIVILVYGFILGCIIWSGNPQGRSMARRYLRVRLFAYIGIEFWAWLLLMNDFPGISFTSIMVPTVMEQGVVFLIWWSYFKKSKRVRNTYGDDLAFMGTKKNT